MIKKLLVGFGSLPKSAIFLSGGGSNAEKLLESVKSSVKPLWNPVVIVTDAPLTSRAGEIARKYGLPFEALDIREFYRSRGESRISLATERGRQIRGEWTTELRKLLNPYSVDFGILAGFVPLTNITSDFPCLNVHPGDLTVEENGRRIFAGLHTIPVETAIIREYRELRSSVIIAQPYTGSGGEMDTGPVLGISRPVKIDLMGRSRKEILKIYNSRPPQRPPGGYKDLPEEIAKYNQELLKRGGDWIVFPPVVEDFAAGRFGIDEKNILHYLFRDGWIPVKTVLYGLSERKPVIIPEI